MLNQMTFPEADYRALLDAGVDTGSPEQNSYCVYIHTNKENGKVYVGMTKDLERRWKNEGYEYRRCVGRPFAQAIGKYGWDGFTHAVVSDGLTFEDACSLEMKLIAEHKSNCSRYSEPSFGYNLTDGGDGTKGRPRTQAEKQHLSEINRGENHYRYGKHQPPETIAKIKKTLTGKYVGELNPRYGKKNSPETRAAISRALQGRFVGAKNPKYGKSPTEETRQKMRDNHANVSGDNNPRARGVMCVETGEVFTTIKAAAAVEGICRQALGKAAKDGHQTIKGHHWVFVESAKIE